MTEVRGECLERALVTLRGRYRDDEILTGPVVTTATLGVGAALILDAVVEDDVSSLRFDGLKRVNEPSRPAEPHYIPLLVYEGEKVRSGLPCRAQDHQSWPTAPRSKARVAR